MRHYLVEWTPLIECESLIIYAETAAQAMDIVQAAYPRFATVCGMTARELMVKVPGGEDL